MQSTRSLIVGASISALINLAVTGGAEAQQSADTTTAPTSKTAHPKTAKKPRTAKQLTETQQMAIQMQALKDQVDALQKRLDSTAVAGQKTQAQADAAATQAASASAQAATATAATAAIPTQVKTAVDAAKPKTDKLYYKGVTLTLGGFAAFESVYRSRNETADIASNWAALPYNNSSVGQTHELRFTARQSRISALIQGDVSPETHLGMYGEFDFLAAAQTANSNESNSYSPRIRHLYGQIDWDTWGLHLLAGQSWSLITLNGKGLSPRNELLPATIDAQYVPGFTWTRQPQIRLTKDIGTNLWAAVSLENPQTTFYTGANPLPATVHLTYNATGGSAFNSANTLSLNHIPDVVAKIAYEPVIADRTLHLEAYGLYRSFYERLNYANQNASGGGGGLGVTFQIIPKVLDFQASGLVGKGIGRYGSAQLADVTFDQTGRIRPISEVAALAGLTLHAGPKLDVYFYAGEEKESAESYNLVAGGVTTPYGYGNPLYSNAGCAYETAVGGCVGNSRFIEQATLGFWHKPYVGAYGRIQWGLQYSHTERKAFAGAAGIAPVAIDNMGFVSFRYYPF